ncbi:MAG TPA: hypothetical protein VN720_07825 [Rudaea sp.]|nr:hypothetical protein [Rudaea sp.]
MKVPRGITALLVALVAASAWAQSAPQPLNLKLPPEAVPVESAEAAPAPDADGNAAVDALDAKGAPIPAAGPEQMPAGVQDPDGRPRNPYAATMPPKCDDATYNQPQMHGSVTAGVVGGSHVSGNYQSGTVNVSQAFGSCDKPAGGMNISIGVSQGNFNGRPSSRRSLNASAQVP